MVEQAARSKYRAFWGAWVGFAIPIGLLLGFGSVIFVKSLMTPEDFIAWGWRIFFVIGFLVAIVGLVIRTRTMDSFVFEQHKAQVGSRTSGEPGLAGNAAGPSCAPRWSTPCSAAHSFSISCSAPAT